jgi:argininosuccinate synthase
MTRRIVVPVSGSAQSLAAIATLGREHAADVVALVLDLGQGHELEDLRDRALAAGAVRAHVLDIREEFARDYVLPALRNAGGSTEASASDLAAPLIASKVAEIAAIEDATPVLELEAKQSTLWGRTGAFVWTKDAMRAPEVGAQVDIEFANGTPSAINGIAMRPTELIEIVNIIAGHHGVGRIEMGETSREAPAAVVLQEAYDALAAAAEGKTGGMSGSVRIGLLKGRHTVLQCDVAPVAAQ